MHEDIKMIFKTYKEAKNYLPSGKRGEAPCSFCLRADFETQL